MKNVLFVLFISGLMFSGNVFADKTGAIITNGGFENGWEAWSKGGHADMTWDVTDKVVRSGKKALHVQNKSKYAPNVYGTISQKIVVKPETKYQFSLWIKAEKASHMWFVGGAGWEIRKPLPAGTYGWRHIVAYYRTKKNERIFPFIINFDGQVENVWIDDISVDENWIDDEVKALGEKAEVVDVINAGGRIGELLKEYNDLKGKLPGLRKKVEWYGWQKHIPMEYVTARYEIIKRFIDSGLADVASGKTGRAEYVLDVINELYTGAITDADAYLSGKKSPPSFSRYVTGKIKIDEYAFEADAKFATTQEQERRKMIFVGFGHFDQVRRDLSLFHKLGLNIVQIEIGPNRSIIVPSKDPDKLFDIDTRTIKSDIVKILKQAEACNISVSLLLSPHYFPKFIIDKYPEMKLHNGFLRYDVHHPVAKQVIKAYLEAIVPLVKDYKSLHSFCISNEPHYKNPGGSAYKDEWINWLKRNYSGDVMKVNAVYKTEYDDFTDIPITDSSDKYGSAAYYDWVIFNSELFAGWHQWMADIVHTLAPDIPLKAKFRVHCTFDPTISREGVDPELFSEFFDINGCDASCYWNANGILSSYINEMAVYDMLASFRKAPIFNSENHIINDGDKGNYDRGRAAHTRVVLWQGAVHRNSATAIWLWERGSYELFQYRPDCLNAVSTTALDLNRLVDEVVALQNISAKVAILYALPAFVHSTHSYEKTLKLAYRAVSLSGIPVEFISEKQIAKGDLSKYVAVIIPQTESIHAATIKKLADFRTEGKVLIVTDDVDGTIAKDEHLFDLSLAATAARKELISKATVLSPVDFYELKEVAGFRRGVDEFLVSAGIGSDVRLIDVETESIVMQVEWRTAQVNGRKIVNIANYGMKPVTVHLLYKGEEQGRVKNLFDNEYVNADNLLLPALSVTLLEL